MPWRFRCWIISSYTELDWKNGYANQNGPWGSSNAATLLSDKEWLYTRNYLQKTKICLRCDLSWNIQSHERLSSFTLMDQIPRGKVWISDFGNKSFVCVDYGPGIKPKRVISYEEGLQRILFKYPTEKSLKAKYGQDVPHFPDFTSLRLELGGRQTGLYNWQELMVDGYEWNRNLGSIHPT